MEVIARPARDVRVTVRAAVTAAGISTRMGATKALLPWGERTFLAAMLDTLRRAGIARPAVVVGADGERVSEEARRSGATPLRNPDYRDGRFTSIRVAARWALEPRDGESLPALLLWPVDCPGVDVKTLAVLRDTARVHPDANVVPTFAGRGGHPVVLCAATLSEIFSAPGDASLRDLILRAPAGRILVAVDDGAVLDNLNTRADHEAFLRTAREARVDG